MQKAEGNDLKTSLCFDALDQNYMYARTCIFSALTQCLGVNPPEKCIFTKTFSDGSITDKTIYFSSFFLIYSIYSHTVTC